MSDQPKSPDSEVWNKAVDAARKEPRDVLVFDKAAVRKALHDSRERRGVRVRQSTLP